MSVRSSSNASSVNSKLLKSTDNFLNFQISRWKTRFIIKRNIQRYDWCSFKTFQHSNIVIILFKWIISNNRKFYLFLYYLKNFFLRKHSNKISIIGFHDWSTIVNPLSNLVTIFSSIRCNQVRDVSWNFICISLVIMNSTIKIFFRVSKTQQ